MLSFLIERRASKTAGVALSHPVLAEWLGSGPMSAAGQAVTVNTALQASAVYACVRNTAETIASLPCVLKRVSRDEGGRKRSEDAVGHPLFSVLLETPNAWQTAFDYWEMVVEHLELRGNHYARVVRDGNGQTVALEPLHPDRVRPLWSNGRPAYEVQPRKETGRSGRDILLSDEMFHIRGPLQGDGLLGSSPIHMHRETIGLALAARNYGARFFANDARPSGALTVLGTLDEEGHKRLAREWKAAYGGENRHGTAILEEGTKYESIAMSNQDAQFLELIGATDLQIARLFRTPPYKIGIIEKSTLNNVEQQNRAWVTDKLAPLAERIEDAIARDLLTTRGRRSLTARFDFAELLRGDIKTRTEANAKNIQWGVLSPNDVREREGLNPIGPEGDLYVSPLNMQPMAALLSALEGSGGSGDVEPEEEEEDDA